MFEREAREFQSFRTFVFQLRHENMMRVAHLYRKKVTRKSTLDYKLNYDEHLTRASRSNSGTESSEKTVSGYNGESRKYQDR